MGLFPFYFFFQEQFNKDYPNEEETKMPDLLHHALERAVQEDAFVAGTFFEDQQAEYLQLPKIEIKEVHFSRIIFSNCSFF